MTKIKRIDKLLRARRRIQERMNRFEFIDKQSILQFKEMCELSAKYNTYISRETARIRQMPYGKYLMYLSNRLKKRHL